MIDLRLSFEALSQSRFAYSPLGEVASSLRLLGATERGHLAPGWVREARMQTKGLAAMDLLYALCPRGNITPDFLSRVNTDPTTSFDSQLDELARLDDAEIWADIAQVWRGTARPAVLEQLARAGNAGEQIAAAVDEYAATTLTPLWPRIRAVIEDDIAYRATQALTGGLYDLFTDLHPEVTLDDTTLRVDKPHHPDATYQRAELTLIPGVFVWPNLFIGHTPGRFDLYYGVRGVTRVWNPDADSPETDGLAALLGRTRAAILTALDLPKSTLQLARQLAVAPASISAHLKVLRGNGLLTSRRAGRLVLYQQTPLGESIVAASRQHGRRAG